MNLLAVNYHYFRAQAYASGIYPITPDAFMQQLEALSKQYRFMSQQQLSDCISSCSYPEGNYCMITFDDGLKEQMQAFELLQSQGIPAIFYVPTKPLTDQVVLDVHKLHHVRTQMSDAQVMDSIGNLYPDAFKEIDMDAARRQYRYDNEQAQQLKYLLNFSLLTEQKEKVIDSCFAALVKDETEFAQQLYMSEADIILLAEHDMLGSHGHAHIPLAMTDEHTAKTDMATSINYLESLTDLPVRSFAYPYGSNTAVTENTSNYFAGTRVEFAFTMWRGFNTASYISEKPLLLHRVDTNDAPGGKSNSKEFEAPAGN